MPTTTLIGAAAAPAASGLVTSQVTVLASVLQFQPLPPLADTRFSGTGTMSVTTSGNCESLGPRLDTWSVYVSLFVPASKVPVWLLTIRISADCDTGVTSVEVLLARCGSRVLLLTVPVLEIDAPTNEGASVTLRTRPGSFCPAASPPDCVQLRSSVIATHVHPLPALETYVSPLGRSSITVIGPAASLGPRLETARVYAYESPDTNGPLSVLTMRRSACVVEVLLVVETLLPLTGSGVGLLTDAVFTIVCDTTEDASDTVSVITLADAPAASGVAFVQVTRPLAKPQTQPVPAAETNPSLPGSVSMTVSVAAASLGPALA